MLTAEDLQKSGAYRGIFTQDGPMLFGLGEGRDCKVEAWEERRIGVDCGIRGVGIVFPPLWQRGRVLAKEGGIFDRDQRKRVNCCFMPCCPPT